MRSKRGVSFTIKIIVAAALLILAFVGSLFLNRYLEKRTYKLEYVKLIKKYSDEYELNPYLVAAVMHVESGNNPTALSHVGAVGLMQIMPDTGEWIAAKLKEPEANIDLTDPDTNIRYGCWYLRFLSDRFSVLDTAVAAYNAGHNKVASWLKNEEYSVDGEALTEIPYKETRNYIERVLRAYDKYKKLYPDAF